MADEKKIWVANGNKSNFYPAGTAENIVPMIENCVTENPFIRDLPGGVPIKYAVEKIPNLGKTFDEKNKLIINRNLFPNSSKNENEFKYDSSVKKICYHIQSGIDTPTFQQSLESVVDKFLKISANDSEQDPHTLIFRLYDTGHATTYAIRIDRRPGKKNEILITDSLRDNNSPWNNAAAKAFKEALQKNNLEEPKVFYITPTTTNGVAQSQNTCTGISAAMMLAISGDSNLTFAEQHKNLLEYMKYLCQNEQLLRKFHQELIDLGLTLVNQGNGTYMYALLNSTEINNLKPKIREILEKFPQFKHANALHSELLKQKKEYQSDDIKKIITAHRIAKGETIEGINHINYMSNDPINIAQSEAPVLYTILEPGDNLGTDPHAKFKSAIEKAVTICLENQAKNGKRPTPQNFVFCAHIGSGHWATYVCNTDGEIMVINSLPGYMSWDKAAIQGFKDALKNNNPKDPIIIRTDDKNTKPEFKQIGTVACGYITAAMSCAISPGSLKKQQQSLETKMIAVCKGNGSLDEYVCYDDLRKEQDKLSKILADSSTNQKKTAITRALKASQYHTIPQEVLEEEKRKAAAEKAKTENESEKSALKDPLKATLSDNSPQWKTYWDKYQQSLPKDREATAAERFYAHREAAKALNPSSVWDELILAKFDYISQNNLAGSSYEETFQKNFRVYYIEHPDSLESSCLSTHARVLGKLFDIDSLSKPDNPELWEKYWQEYQKHEAKNKFLAHQKASQAAFGIGWPTIKYLEDLNYIASFNEKYAVNIKDDTKTNYQTAFQKFFLASRGGDSQTTFPPLLNQIRLFILIRETQAALIAKIRLLSKNPNEMGATTALKTIEEIHYALIKYYNTMRFDYVSDTYTLLLKQKFPFLPEKPVWEFNHSAFSSNLNLDTLIKEFKNSFNDPLLEKFKQDNTVALDKIEKTVEEARKAAAKKIITRYTTHFFMDGKDFYLNIVNQQDANDNKQYKITDYYDNPPRFDKELVAENYRKDLPQSYWAFNTDKTLELSIPSNLYHYTDNEDLHLRLTQRFNKDNNYKVHVYYNPAGADGYNILFQAVNVDSTKPQDKVLYKAKIDPTKKSTQQIVFEKIKEPINNIDQLVSLEIDNKKPALSADHAIVIRPNSNEPIIDRTIATKLQQKIAKIRLFNIITNTQAILIAKMKLLQAKFKDHDEYKLAITELEKTNSTLIKNFKTYPIITGDTEKYEFNNKALADQMNWGYGDKPPANINVDNLQFDNLMKEFETSLITLFQEPFLAEERKKLEDTITQSLASLEIVRKQREEVLKKKLEEEKKKQQAQAPVIAAGQKTNLYELGAIKDGNKRFILQIVDDKGKEIAQYKITNYEYDNINNMSHFEYTLLDDSNKEKNITTGTHHIDLNIANPTDTCQFDENSYKSHLAIAQHFKKEKKYQIIIYYSAQMNGAIVEATNGSDKVQLLWTNPKEILTSQFRNTNGLPSLPAFTIDGLNAKHAMLYKDFFETFDLHEKIKELQQKMEESIEQKPFSGLSHETPEENRWHYMKQKKEEKFNETPKKKSPAAQQSHEDSETDEDSESFEEKSKKKPPATPPSNTYSKKNHSRFFPSNDKPKSSDKSESVETNLDTTTDKKISYEAVYKKLCAKNTWKLEEVKPESDHYKIHIEPANNKSEPIVIKQNSVSTKIPVPPKDNRKFPPDARTKARLEAMMEINMARAEEFITVNKLDKEQAKILKANLIINCGNDERIREFMKSYYESKGFSVKQENDNRQNFHPYVPSSSPSRH